MLTIQIKNGYNEVVAVINDIFSLQVDDEVNKGGKLKLKFPTEKRLQEKPLQKGYRISITYGLKIGKVIRLFEGYITDVIVKTTQVEIKADNWLSYLQYRMVRSDRTYTDQTISSVVSAVFNELNNTSELPMQLGLNDCDSKITKDFKVGTSFYDILKYCWEAEKDLIVRVHNGYLEVSKNAGEIKEGVWEYDARNTVGTNITDRSRKDSMDEFYTYIQSEGGSVSDEEFEENMKLIFEKYDSEGALKLPSGIAIPSINISRDIDWWDFNPGDRKNIRLITGYEWLPLQYLGLIQSRKVNISANGGIKAEIKISEEYKADTNILDLVLINLRGKKNGSEGGGDMTNYYTKSETTAIINSAVSGKANVNHTHLVQDITNFAQAVGNLISSALSSYYTKTEVDSALSGKSDTGHGHIFSDIAGLETALEGKADVEHTHQISEVSGLQSALNNKANKNDTYTKTEVDGMIPTVNNSTITIQINGNTLKSITLNQATGETINIPIPTKVSDLNNDSGFITKAVSDLTNYYTKSQTYTKSEVDGMISNFGGFEVVATLPTTNIKTNVIYLKGPIGTGVDRYEEYIYYSNTWTLIGETSVDLTNYIDKNTAFITINGVAYKFGDSLTTPNTEYDTMTQQEATAGTGTTARVITPKVLVDTIANMISGKADKSQIKVFVITESMVSVSTDATKGVAPYNTSYGYTNITVNDNAGVEWVDGALYIFVINTSMVVASAYRNVRIGIGTNGAYKPLMNAGNSILAGSSYFTKGRTDLYVYKSTYQSGGALHMNNDTSYSAMSVAEGKTGTATSSRVMRADYLKQIIEYYLQNVATPTGDNYATNKKYVDDSIGGGVLTLTYDGETLGVFGANDKNNKTIAIPVGSSITELTENFVRTMIFAGVGDYDNVFRASSGLYRILNALDDHDNLGLEKGEVWEDIVSDTTDMSAITHSYSVMVAVASSEVAMEEVLKSANATKEISECWNSISIIAESELGSEMYLNSENGITYLFTYQTAQDAFFGDPAKKQEIVSGHIMVIVNSNTLLGNLYTDNTVANCIVDSQEALNTIAGNGTKLGIVDDSSEIMVAIATNTQALGIMSNNNFTSYILEDEDYLDATVQSTAGQNRINSMDADDLLPAIFYWTGLSGYSTFEALAESDSAMEVVQSSDECMKFIECNDEANEYFGNVPNAYQEIEYIQSTGTQYIDTNVVINKNIKIEIDLQFTSTTTQQRLFGGGYDDGSSGITFCSYINGSSQRARATSNGLGNRQASSVSANTSRNKFVLDNTRYIVYNSSGTQVYNATNSATITNTDNWTIPLLAYKQMSSSGAIQRQASAKLYSCKIRNNGDLVREFYPCYRKSDNVAGLRDKVNRVFYTNAGSGTFTQGQKVYRRSDLQYCSYIQTAGGPYINLGYIPNYNTKIYAKFEPTRTSYTNEYNNPLFCTRNYSGGNEYAVWSTVSEQSGSVGTTFNSVNNPLTKFPEGTVIEFQYDKNGGSYNTHTWTWSPSSGNPGNTILLFGVWSSNSVDNRKFYGKLWSYKIRDNGTLVRDLKPCYGKSTGEIGLRDEVNEKFYRNNGSGSFTKGSDI